MAVELNHIIVHATDKQASAEFLAGILGVDVLPEMGPFVPVEVDNGVTLDFMDSSGFTHQHCAFLISEEEFDASFARLQDSGVAIYADPDRRRPGEINHRFDGRGVYFDDPDGHLMEIMTRSMPMV